MVDPTNARLAPSKRRRFLLVLLVYWFATPPEFRGHDGLWTPEMLFVAAVDGCIMTSLMPERNLDLLSYESRAEGRLDLDQESAP